MVFENTNNLANGEINQGLLKYFQENINKFDINQLKEKAISNGFSEREVNLVIEKVRGNLVGTGVTAFPKKPFFGGMFWTVFVVVVIGIALTASYFVFFQKDKSPEMSLEDIDYTSLPTEISQVAISDSEKQEYLSNKNFPSSYSMKADVTIEGSITIEAYYKEQGETKAKFKSVAADPESGTLIGETVSEYTRSSKDKPFVETFRRLCSLGTFCLDHNEKTLKDMRENSATQQPSAEEVISGGALLDKSYIYLGKKDILGISCPCFKSTKNQERLVCKHPEYDIIMYLYTRYGNMEIETTTREIKINTPIDDSVFEIDSGEEMGEWGEIQEELLAFMGGIKQQQ